jgi:UDP-glucose 4-epimerase
LGTGRGVTVRELVTAFEKVTGSPLNKADGLSRPGDVAGSFCNADTARRLLGWQAQLSIEEGIADALKWGKMKEKLLK